jgi:Family of unknown function (DUF5760)
MDPKETIKQWIDLKSDITNARKDIAVLNKREKELRQAIKRFMIDVKTDEVEVEQKKVVYKSRMAKGSLTREVIKNGLLSFFGNQTQADGCFQAIVDAAPETLRDSVSLVKK